MVITLSKASLIFDNSGILYLPLFTGNRAHKKYLEMETHLYHEVNVKV